MKSPDAMAIDCCWLMMLDVDVDDFVLNIDVINGMHRNGVSLLLDHENQIHGEYSRNVSGTLGRRLLESYIKSGRVRYYRGKLTRRQNEALDRIGFDPSDRPYLAVASQDGSPFLTTEEKHLRSSQVEAVEHACGVVVVDTAGAATILT